MYKRIEELMNEKGITAYRLCKETGISNTSLHDWKCGRSKPKLDKLIILAKYFNVSIDYFIK